MMKLLKKFYDFLFGEPKELKEYREKCMTQTGELEIDPPVTIKTKEKEMERDAIVAVVLDRNKDENYFETESLDFGKVTAKEQIAIAATLSNLAADLTHKALERAEEGE